MITEHDSLDDMFAEMARAEDAANARITPAQEALRDDHTATRYFARAVYDIVVYGEVPPASDPDLRARGYLTGTAYSIACPEGESGDTHVSVCIPIGRPVFEMAREHDWPVLGPDMPLLLAHALYQAEQLAMTP